MNSINLISYFNRGEEKAFRCIFEMHHSPLLYFCNKIINNWEGAEDIVLITFQSLFIRCAQFQTLDNIKAFLYITSKNNCLNYLEHRTSQETGRKEYETRLLQIGNDKSIEMLMMEAELLNSIHAKMEKLPKKCREIFKLTYFEGLKAGEIAKILNISTSTITTQRSIAIKFMKALLTGNN